MIFRVMGIHLRQNIMFSLRKQFQFENKKYIIFYYKYIEILFLKLRKGNKIFLAFELKLKNGVIEY